MVTHELVASTATRTASALDWNFLFHAEFLDTDSGLYNYGFRYYHPELGRWISRDPIDEKGGLNLYIFSKNGHFIDFLGLKKIDLTYTIDKKEKEKSTKEKARGIGANPGQTFETVADALADARKQVGKYKSDGTDPCNCIRNLKIYVHGGENAEKGGIIQFPEGAITGDSLNFCRMMGGPDKMHPPETAVKGLDGFKGLICEDGQTDFRVCFGGAGDKGKKLLDELEKIFGKDKVTLWKVKCESGLLGGDKTDPIDGENSNYIGCKPLQ